MLRWYLITHNLHAFQMVTSRASALGVETFAPSKIKVTRRADCNGVRTTQTQLFPGYLFIRLDPEQVHTSVIAEIPGVREFVRFGGDICTVSNSLIETQRQSLLLRTDQKVTQLELRNVSSEVLEKLSAITMMKCKLARQTAFFELLKHDTEIASKLKHSRIVSVIDRPYVNELIR